MTAPTPWPPPPRKNVTSAKVSPGPVTNRDSLCGALEAPEAAALWEESLPGMVLERVAPSTGESRSLLAGLG